MPKTLEQRPTRIRKKPPTKRQIQAAASKKKIFDTAQALFSKYGYDNVTIADICEEAGVSVGLFYNYYHSKSDISVEAFRLIEDQYSICANSFTEQDTAQDRLLKFSRVMLSYIYQDEYMLQNARIQYTREAQGIPPFVFDSTRPLSQMLLDAVRYGQEKGQLRKDINEHVIVRVLFTYGIGSTIHLLNESDKDTMLKKALSDIELILQSFSL